MTNLDEKTIDAILQAQRTVIRTLHDASTSWLELNVSMAQLKTLIVLSDEGPLPVGQVGCRMGVTLPTASYQVERLVRKGLVERVQDEQDRRRTLVHLTEQATELLRSLRQGRAELMRSWIEQMSSDEVAALQQGLEALAGIAAEHRHDVPDHEEAMLTTTGQTGSSD
jgi:MarR family transcriptional regulator, organic hydroperoxide resistance regulator